MADAETDRAPREQRFQKRMSDAEALMWNVEKDPWLVNFTLPDVLGTPLHWAAITDQADLVQYLIDKGASVSAKGRAGGTALHWAAWRGSDSAVRVLLDNGADVEARSDDEGTPLFWLGRASKEAWGFRGNPVAVAEARSHTRRAKPSGPPWRVWLPSLVCRLYRWPSRWKPPWLAVE